MEQKTFIEASCIYNIHSRKFFLKLLLLKVCESFRFGQIKRLEVYFDLYESSFTYTEKRRPNKYCLCEVNLISCMEVFSLIGQDGSLARKLAVSNAGLARKLAVSNAGCIFAYFCGGHKNNFPT